MSEIDLLVAPQKTEVLSGIAHGLALKDTLTAIVGILETSSGPDTYGSVLLVSADGSRLELGAAPSLDEAYNREIDGLPIGPESGSCGSAAYLGRPVIVTDIETDPLWLKWRAVALRHGLRSCWSVPIVGDGRVLGTFAMYSKTARSPSRFEMELLENLSSLAAVAIEKEIGRSSLAAPAGRQSGDIDEEGRILRQLIESLPAMMAVTRGAEHIVQIANRRFTRAVGLPESRIIGKRLQQVLKCLEPQGLHVTLNRVYTSGRPFVRREMPLVLERARGEHSDLVVNFVCQPVRDVEGRVDGLCLEAMDVTDSVKVRDALMQLQEEKDDFIASVAHDLANPAMVTAGNAAILLRAIESNQLQDTALFRESLEAIAATARRLAMRCAGLMDLARTDTGQQSSLHLEPVDLVPLTRRVFRDFDASGDSHVKRLECAEQNLIGEWDPERIESILANLIGNAIKYSPAEAPVTVVLRRENGMALVEVIDQGVGIDEEELPHLFDRYWRSRRAGSQSGWGIGLATVKHNAELHGAVVGATSCLGKGSRFTVRLPLPVNENPA